MSRPVVVFLVIDADIQSWMQSLVDWAGTGLLDASVRMPTLGSAADSLGHVVLIDGYDAGTDAFIIRNSFGFAWGVGGRCTFAKANMKQGSVQFAVAIVEVVS